MIRKKKKCQELVGGENKLLITISRQKATDIPEMRMSLIFKFWE